MKYFHGLTNVNIELSSRCNKNCWMCGRRKIDKEYSKIAMNYGDMEFELIKCIAEQLPEGIVVQFHNNGESILHPRFGEAVSLFTRQIKCLDTNGKLIVQKASEIIGNLDTLTISVIENDPEGEEQYELVKQFLQFKKNSKPLMIYRCLGDLDLERWRKLEGIMATRALHDPLGSYNYRKRPTVPEIGICLDLLNHMAINKDGKVSICVRFDPLGLGKIGDVNTTPLIDIWYSSKRKKWIQYHLHAKRNRVPLCSHCEYWGVPTG